MKLHKEFFLDELAEMYDVERRVVKALPKLWPAISTVGEQVPHP